MVSKFHIVFSGMLALFVLIFIALFILAEPSAEFFSQKENGKL